MDATGADDGRAPIDEIAETAVEALRALVDDPGQTLPSYVFRPTLRVGGTTGPPL